MVVKDIVFVCLLFTAHLSSVSAEVHTSNEVFNTA